MKPGWVLTIALLIWIAVSDFILPIPAGCLEIMLLGTLVSGAFMALKPASIVAFAQIGALACATLILPGFIWLVKAQRP